MKNLILILALLTLPFLGFAQTDKPVSVSTVELVPVKKVEEITPIKKATTNRNAKYLRVNYKKSNDIISIKAYRKSLKDKVSRKKLC